MRAAFPTSVVLFLFLSLSPSIIAQARPLPQTDPDCQHLVDTALASSTWQEELRSPDLQDKDRLEKINLDSINIFNCVADKKVTINTEVRLLVKDINLFLVFVEGWYAPKENQGQLFTLHLKDVNDPAVKKMRASGIPLAGDDSVLVWRYFSKEYIPFVLKDYFDENVAGISFGKRYIAYIDISPNNGVQFSDANAKKAQQTLSHELVHAYVFQSMGQATKQIPKWYMEGLALYFSGSGEPVVVYRPDGSVVYNISSTPEYEQYNLNFDYLEKIYGRDTLIRLIRQSIIDADPELLLREGGIQNEMGLIERTKVWQNTKGAVKVISVFAGLIFVVLIFRFSIFQRIYYSSGGVNSPEDVERLKDWGLVGGLIRSLRYQNAAEPVLAKHIRLKAAQSLESFEGKRVERALIQALSDPYIEVINVAAETLGKRGCREAGEPLVKAMESHYLRTATRALIDIGDRKFVLPIIRNIWLPTGGIHLHAIDGLRQWHEREDLSEEFQTAILSEEPELRAGAAILVGCLKINKLRPLLPGLLKDSSDLVREAALVGMAHLPDGLERDRVVKMMQSMPAAVQEKYLQFLSMFSDDEVEAVAMRVYSSLQSDYSHLIAIGILKDCEFDYAMSLLMKLIQKAGSPDIKKQAIDYILSLEDVRTVPYMRTILDKERNGTLDAAMVAKIEMAFLRLYIR
jgi:hypothetical protein